MTATEHDDHADIREAVAKLCAQFPGEYWRKLDREMAYPSAFVDALTKAGYLSVLIPEEYDGAGLKLSAATAILEEIQQFSVSHEFSDDVCMVGMEVSEQF